MALRELLPIPSTSNAAKKTKRRHRVAIYLLVLSGVIFRSELALLLFTHLAFLLLSGSTSLRTVIPSGLVSALIALTLSVPLDSYFWQRTLWPELAGFIYNAIEGKSSDWGTSPFHAYFTNFLPKLLLNPLVSLVLIPLSIYLPSSRRAATAILVPILAFIAIYSIQPHKEARFIIYVVPPLTTCAAVAASYVTTHRSRSAIYRLLYPLLILSILGSFAISTLMLGISSLNYPGGEAIARLQDIVLADDSSTKQIAVHIDVLSCMTGITRFQQEYPSPPLLSSLVTSILSSISPTSSSPENYYPKEVHFDKTEDEEALLLPSFWSQFEYVLTSTPETVIGKWIHVETVRGYSGIEILKPGMASASDKGREEKVYDDSSAEIKDGEAARGERTERPFSVSRLLEVVEEEGLYNAVRKVGRRFTGGWWVGPRMEEKIWILKRERGDYLHT
jgi:alpha-1,6-mannosyltransferase